MNVNRIENTSNFRGIKLSRFDFEDSREIVEGLKLLGSKCPGYKYFVGDYKNITKQASICDYIRNNYAFRKNEFGVVYFPWSKDTYLIGNKFEEAKIFDTVKLLDENAKLFFLV